MGTMSETAYWYRYGTLQSAVTTSSKVTPYPNKGTYVPSKGTSSYNEDGFRPPTSYVAQYNEHKGWVGTWIECNGSFKSRVRTVRQGDLYKPLAQDIIVPPSAETDVQSNMVDRSMTEALSTFQSSEVNYGTFIAESNKSLSLIADKVTDISDLVKAAKRGNVPAVKRKLQSIAATYRGMRLDRGFAGRKFLKGAGKISNAWLEAIYGIAPLIDDCYGISQDLESSVSRSGSHIHATRNLSENIDYHWFHGGTVPFSATGKRGCKTRLDYRIENESAYRAARLGFSNLAGIGWELTPYSFVLDWVVPIGTYLQAQSSTVGLKYLGGTSTSWSNYVVEGILNMPEPTPIGESNYSVVQGTYESSYNKMVRSVVNSPRPSLFTKNPISALHLANASALLLSYAAKKNR